MDAGNAANIDRSVAFWHFNLGINYQFLQCFIKKCDKTILLFVKIKYVACKIEYMLPIIAYVNVYDKENRIKTSRRVNLWFQ